MVVLLLAPFLFGSCAKTKGEGFAIYRTRENTPPAQMEILSRIAIAEKPVIASGDIVTYNWNTHDILLTPDAFKRLDAMQIPTTGISFVVYVDESPVYWGAFWTPVSSQSFQGVTIWVPSTSSEDNVIQLELGYPSPSFYKGEDPRSEKRIKDALEKAGKLITTPVGTITTKVTSPEGFAIYLTQGNVPVADVHFQSDLKITETSVFASRDIISYNRDTHEIKLTAKAVKRIKDVKVPTSGTTFVACVDRFPMYWEHSGAVTHRNLLTASP